MSITTAKILPGGAQGQCTLTFSVSSDSSGAEVTTLPIILHTQSIHSYQGEKFTSMIADNSNTTTGISGSDGYQVTTSFERNIMTAKIDKAN